MFPVAVPYPGGALGPIRSTSPVRTVAHRYKDDAGWFAWRGISDLDTTAYVLRGRESDVRARFEVYARAQRTVVRSLAMLSWAGHDYSPRTPGYWDALDRTYRLATDYGLTLELGLFADAQIIVPDPHERERWTDAFGDFLAERPTIIPQLANEPFKNGWSDATDPALLALGERLAARLGHREFSIGDPAGEQGEGGAQVADALVQLASHSTMTVIHSDRSQHGHTTRWRRWVDHLEGFTEVVARYPPTPALVHDEPMGAGPQYIDGRRDNDPDAFVAAQMTALCCGLGFTYHWIVEEWPDAASLPGLLAMAPWIDQVPVSSEWHYLNDSWAGAPTHGYQALGKDGKIRHLVNGDRFWTVAYGELDFAHIVWTRSPSEVVYDGARCKVYRG